MDPSSNQAKKSEVGRWSEDEHERFMMGITLHGKDWKKVQEIVGTRSGSQVRSHAQKFFNKLKKNEKKKTTPKKKEELNFDGEVSESENSFMKGVPDDFSNSTPVELVSLIRKESQGGQKINLTSLKKTLQNHMVIQQKQKQESGDEDFEHLNNLKRQNSFKSLNNILSAYENVKDSGLSNQLEDQSFLINLTKRYKKYFAQGGRFENLIDFGNPNEVAAVEKSLRKKSFTLPQGVDGDEQDLNERKKRVITENNLSQLGEKEKDAYRNKILKLKQQEKLKSLAEESQNQQNTENKQKIESQEKSQRS